MVRLRRLRRFAETMGCRTWLLPSLDISFLVEMDDSVSGSLLDAPCFKPWSFAAAADGAAAGDTDVDALNPLPVLHINNISGEERRSTWVVVVAMTAVAKTAAVDAAALMVGGMASWW